MTTRSRRQILVKSARLAAAAFASPWLARLAHSDPLGLPIGIQLYAVKEAMKADAAGTLRKLRHIGFGQVETAGFGKLSAVQFRGLLDDAGLACPSAHLPFDPADLGPAFEDAHALGARYATSGSLHSIAAPAGAAIKTARPRMSHDEAKRIADLANRIGEAAKRAGLQYAYHNHDAEFADLGNGATAYDVLLRETDPELVKFEIDCGWMIFAGHNPIYYFERYPHRFPMIHVKDFLRAKPADGDAGNAGDMNGAELGHGVVDYRPIFAAAAKAGLRHHFVEQEGPFSRMEPLEAARVDYEYLHSLG
jgi:sugar phosphate isomerase/epimerase